MRAGFSVIVFCAVACIACRESQVVLFDRGDAYFPLETGRFLEYQVDSIVFDDAGATNRLDTFSSFIRETVIEEFVDLAGKPAFRIQRQHRKEVDLPWNTTHIWIAANDGSSAVRVEENQRIVKMEFPLTQGKRWNPTRFIDEGVLVPVGTEVISLFAYWDGRILALHGYEEIGAFAFDSVMVCRQADEDTEIERRYVLEKYARGLGLVFREDTILDSRCKRIGDFVPCLGQTWMQKGEKGYIMRMTLINHN